MPLPVLPHILVHGITKWILTIGLIIFGTFWLFPWGNAAETIVSTEGLNAFKNPIYLFDAKGVLLGSLIQVSFLFVIIGISVLKPWGRRRMKENLLIVDGK